ncbi:hypothetical protein [Chitiniphilus shinanonensis]|uniref:hypothetical protein n=1 Tax=Chitiniphilus shinanonensis TaxID=553088 RepID=UPI003033B7AE
MPIASARSPLIVARPEGLYCPAGDFRIDPWRPEPQAVITRQPGRRLFAVGDGVEWPLC